MSRPPGRKPGSRGIHAVEDSALVLPQSIALDTSFIVKALVESEAGHASCTAFVDRIRELGVTVVTSELVLSSLPHLSIPLGDVAGPAAVLMIDYGLASYDAVHAVSAVAAGAEAIVTTDTGFALLPTRMLAIYTDRSRVTACCAKRPA
jgi:predicted nucleic acid-binding protein